MRRALPCPRCGTAKLRKADGTFEDYTIGITPSAFSARSEFEYVCMACRPKSGLHSGGQRLRLNSSLRISKAEFMRLPDLDASV